MQKVKKIIGWIILVVGIVGTANNVAYIATGASGRIGFLTFGVALVILGLWLARPFGKSKEKTKEGET